MSGRVAVAEFGDGRTVAWPVTKPVYRNSPQPGVLFCKNEGSARRLQRFGVAGQNCLAACFGGDGHVITLRGKQCTGRQPDQIHRVGELCRFVKIIHAPYKPPLGIPPGTEVFDVQIPHREHGGRIAEFAANIRPELHPSVKSCPEEREDLGSHFRVLCGQVFRHKLDVGRQPLFIFRGRLADVHCESPSRSNLLRHSPDYARPDEPATEWVTASRGGRGLRARCL